MRDCIFCVLDGVLADSAHRRSVTNPAMIGPVVKGDSVVEPVKELLACMYAADYLIYIYTHRPREAEEDTVEWLHQNGVRYWRLLTVPEVRGVPQAKVKLDLIGSLDLTDRLRFVIDCDEASIRLWRAFNIPCFRLEL